MRRIIQGTLSIILTSIFLTGCTSFELQFRAEIADLRRRLIIQEEKTVSLTAQINDGLSLALCSPELRQLLEDVRKECVPATVETKTVCTTKQIRGAVISADPERRGRFLKFMSHLPHEVIYISNRSSELTPYRNERLVQLSKTALLSSTVFFVVSSPEGGDSEAQRRAQLVEELLLKYKVPPHKIHRWIYGFPANRADIVRPSELPGLGEPKELHRGVWVFRADC